MRLKTKTQRAIFRKCAQSQQSEQKLKRRDSKMNFPSKTKIRAAGETSFARVWKTEQISKRNEGPVNDRGKDAHQYDSLFGECMLWLCVPIPSMVKFGWDHGRDRDDCWLKETPLLWTIFLFSQLWPTFTHSDLRYDVHTHTYTHTHTPTHAVTHQWRGKQRHLEKLSSGRHWHDLRGLAAFPITLPLQ